MDPSGCTIEDLTFYLPLAVVASGRFISSTHVLVAAATQWQLRLEHFSYTDFTVQKKKATGSSSEFANRDFRFFQCSAVQVKGVMLDM